MLVLWFASIKYSLLLRSSPTQVHLRWDNTLQSLWLRASKQDVDNFTKLLNVNLIAHRYWQRVKEIWNFKATSKSHNQNTQENIRKIQFFCSPEGIQKSTLTDIFWINHNVQKDIYNSISCHAWNDFGTLSLQLQMSWVIYLQTVMNSRALLSSMAHNSHRLETAWKYLKTTNQPIFNSLWHSAGFWILFCGTYIRDNHVFASTPVKGATCPSIGHTSVHLKACRSQVEETFWQIALPLREVPSVWAVSLHWS